MAASVALTMAGNTTKRAKWSRCRRRVTISNARRVAEFQNYTTMEKDDYVYVRLQDGDEACDEPFTMRHYKEEGWHTIRLINRFQNNVTNCVENFIDIPHTVYVHPGIFRNERRQKIDVEVTRKDGIVKATYKNETDNLGWFSKLLNPGGSEIVHTDEFFMPNVSCVEYIFGPKRHFIITSQSIPLEDDETLVYTDLTLQLRHLEQLAAPIVRWQGQAIINQDIDALANQMEVIKKYGSKFANTPADTIHVYVETIQRELERGKDPRKLPEKCRSIDVGLRRCHGFSCRHRPRHLGTFHRILVPSFRNRMVERRSIGFLSIGKWTIGCWME